MTEQVETLDPKKVEAEIIEMTGLTREQLSQLPTITKFFDISGAKWERSKPVPRLDEMTVAAIFGGDDQDVRVYAAPTAEKSAKGELLMPTRFTLNRRAASCLFEQMPFATFKEEIADELILQWEGTLEDEEDEEDGAPGVPAGAQPPAPPQAPSASVTP